MENLDRNVLFNLVLKLSLEDISKFCLLSKRFNELICESSDFWRIKLFQDFNFKTEEKNTKKIYQDILENKNYCNRLLLEGKVKEDQFVINSLDSLFEQKEYEDYLVFLFLRSKILDIGETIPNYFDGIYNKYIKSINYKYGNKITKSSDFNVEEIEIFINILKKIKGNNFENAFIQRMINGDIPLTILWKDICETPVYFN